MYSPSTVVSLINVTAIRIAEARGQVLLQRRGVRSCFLLTKAVRRNP